MGQKPETRLVNKILKALKAQGGWWIKIHGSPFQVSGVPDIVGCYAGRFIALEVKMPGLEGTASSRQVYIMDKIKGAGGITTVVSSDLDALRVLYALGVADGQKDLP